MLRRRSQARFELFLEGRTAIPCERDGLAAAGSLKESRGSIVCTHKPYLCVTAAASAAFWEPKERIAFSSSARSPQSLLLTPTKTALTTSLTQQKQGREPDGAAGPVASCTDDGVVPRTRMRCAYTRTHAPQPASVSRRYPSWSRGHRRRGRFPLLGFRAGCAQRDVSPDPQRSLGVKAKFVVQTF